MNNKKKSNAARHFAKVQVESQGKGKNQFQKKTDFYAEGYENDFGGSK